MYSGESMYQVLKFCYHFVFIISIIKFILVIPEAFYSICLVDLKTSRILTSVTLCHTDELILKDIALVFGLSQRWAFKILQINLITVSQIQGPDIPEETLK